MTTRDLLYTALSSQDAFVVRAVRFLAAEIGVRQFLDLGSGIANGTMLHTVAQQIIPAARVVYVTGDPVVLAQARELPAGPGRGSVDDLKADLGDPAGILEHAAATLDFDQPVAVVLTGVLHLLPDTEDATDPDRIVSHLVDTLAAESHVVIAHLACDIHPAEMAEVERHFNETTAETWQFRNHDQVRGFFAGLDLVDPGMVQVDEWRPDDQPGPVWPPEGRTNPLWVGVGRKP